MDKRTKKTEDIIEKVFIDLLKNKKVEEITITELTKLADLNRRTFYIHYTDIYDLQEKVEKHELEKFSSITTFDEENIEASEYFEKIINYTFKNINTLGVLCRNPNSNLMRNLLELTIGKGKEVLPFKKDVDIDAVLSFACWGSIGYLHTLIRNKNNSDESVRELSELIKNTLKPHLQST